MSVIIRLQNLAMNAGSSDIRQFFGNLQVPGGGVRIIGGKYGDAFVAFLNETEGRLALKLSGRQLCNEIIYLYPSSVEEMNAVMDGKDVKPTAINVVDNQIDTVNNNVGNTYFNEPSSDKSQLTPSYTPESINGNNKVYNYSYSANNDVSAISMNNENALSNSAVDNKTVVRKVRNDPRIRAKEPPTEYSLSTSKISLADESLSLLNGIINNVKKLPPGLNHTSAVPNQSFSNTPVDTLVESVANTFNIPINDPVQIPNNIPLITNTHNINEGKVLLGDKPAMNTNLQVDPYFNAPMNQEGDFTNNSPNNMNNNTPFGNVFEGPNSRGGFNGSNNRGMFDGEGSRGNFRGPMNRGAFNGPMHRGTFDPNRGLLNNPMNRGTFEGPQGRGSFNGPMNRGVFNGPMNRGAIDGPRGRGTFGRPMNRGGFDASRGRGGFDGAIENVGYENNKEEFNNQIDNTKDCELKGQNEIIDSPVNNDFSNQNDNSFDDAIGRGGFDGSRGGRGGFVGTNGRGGFNPSRGRGSFDGPRGRGGFNGQRGRGGFEGNIGRGRGGFDGTRGRGRGIFDGPRGRGGFDGPRGRGGFDGPRGRGGFDGPRGRGGFDGPRGRGGFDGPRGRGGFDGPRGRGGFDGPRGRGVFDGPRGRGGFDGPRGRGGFDGPRGRGGFDGPRGGGSFDGPRINQEFGEDEYDNKIEKYDDNDREIAVDNRRIECEEYNDVRGYNEFHDRRDNMPQFDSMELSDNGYTGNIRKRHSEEMEPIGSAAKYAKNDSDDAILRAMKECKEEVAKEQDSCCVHIYNLPSFVRSRSIHTFLGEDCIIENDGVTRLKIVSNFRRSSTAYVFFHHNRLAKKALALNKKEMGGDPVYIRLCSKAEFDQIICNEKKERMPIDKDLINDKPRSSSERTHSRKVDTSKRYREERDIERYIYIRGLPSDTNLTSVKSFLGDVDIVDGSSLVYVGRDESVSCITEMSSKRDLSNALRLHKTLFKTSECVSVYEISKDEYKEKKNHMKGYFKLCTMQNLYYIII